MSGANQLPSIDKIFKDDDDFMPSVGSNLAAIFGTSQKNQESSHVNSPAQHASLKQCKAGHNQSQSFLIARKEVILAKAVHAFKLQNGLYAPIGKVGIALIGNILCKQFEIILYKGKQNYLSVATITSDFGYIIQADNYTSYYDANKDNWSIAFENSDSSIQFAREICVSKHFVRVSKVDDNILYQDLNAPAKNAATAKEGDGISIKYWTSSDITQPLKTDNNSKQSITLEISKDDNWERLLIGTTVGLKRVMIIPSNKQIGLGPGFPKDKEIVMEFEVISIFGNPELSPPIMKPQDADQRATIISRVAKMGQSILFKLPPSITTDSEDTDEEISHTIARHKRVELAQSALKKHSHSNQSLDVLPQKPVLTRREMTTPTFPITQRPVMPAPTFAPQWAPSQVREQYMSIDGQLLQIPQQVIAQPLATSMDPTLNVFLSETRTQNTELRMGLSKISDNVQKLLDKFHVLELQLASTPSTTDKSLETTLKTLLDIKKTEQNIQTEDCKTQHVANTERTFEDQHLLTINTHLSSKLSDIESKLEDANETITTQSAYIEEIKQRNATLQQTNLMLTNQIQELEKNFLASQDRVTELLDEMKERENINSSHKERNAKLENRLTELMSRYREMENTLAAYDSSNWDDKTNEIKEIMNEVYHRLSNSFFEENYSTEYIKSTILRTLKNVACSRIVGEETKKRQEERKKDETTTSASNPNITEHSEKTEAILQSTKNDDTHFETWSSEDIIPSMITATDATKQYTHATSTESSVNACYPTSGH